MAKELTTIAIERLKAGEKRREIPDGRVGGLYHIIQPSGKRSWAFRYRFAGKPRKFTFQASDFKAARKKAGEAKDKIAEGIDPGAEKKAARAAALVPANDLVEVVAKQFVSHYAKRQLKASTARDVERVLDKEIVDLWRGRRLSMISRADVRGLLDDIVDRGSPISANPPMPGVQYAGFCDPSGGLSDSMTLAVAHLDANAICILDCLLEIRPPFDPQQAVAECVAVCKRYGVTKITGDKYAGLWPVARFAECAIVFEQSAAPKSDQYLNLLPLINSQRIELLDVPRLSAQLCGLERRTARSGRDSVDHSPGSHDDAANAVAGVLTQQDLDRRPLLSRQGAMLTEGKPVILPDVISTFVAVLCINETGMYAAVRAAKTLYGEHSLIILDFDAGPLHSGILDNLTDFDQFKCRCQNGILAVVPEGFARDSQFNGHRAIEIIDGRLPELQLLAAARSIDRGAVKLAQLAEEKARALPFGAALAFRAGENIDDPLRCAILTIIAISCEEPTQGC